MVSKDKKIEVSSNFEAEKEINLIVGKLDKFNEKGYSSLPLEQKSKAHVLVMEKENNSDVGFHVFKYPHGNENINSKVEFFDIIIKKIYN